MPRQVLELAPDTGRALRAIDLPPGDDVGWFSINRLALGRDVLWAIGADDRLLAIDPGGTSAPAVVPGIEATGVAADGDGAWAVTAGPPEPRARARLGGRGA